MKVLALLFLLCCSSFKLFSQDPYSGEYEIRKISNKPILDGVFESSIWSKNYFVEFIPKYCTPMIKYPTSAALLMDDTNLFIAIKANNSLKADFKGNPRQNDDPKIFEDDVIEILIYNEDTVIYQHIVINFFGAVHDSLVRINRGESDVSWNSNLVYAMAHSSGLLNQRSLEIKIPLANLNIKSQQPNFRFSIIRSQKLIVKTPIPEIKPENKNKVAKEKSNPPKELTKTIVNESSFFKVGENSNVYSAFGYATFGNKKKLSKPNEQQIVLGYSSQIASMDVYFKAVNEFEGLIPEGCEIGHGATLRHHDHIPVSQLPMKIDGYLRTYVATKIPEYLSFGEQVLGKIEKLLANTKDFKGEPWLPFWDLVDRSGVVNPYDNGPDNMRGRIAITYDQSKAKFTTFGNKFIDSFGFGFYQISLIKMDLPDSYNKKAVNILKQIIAFYHRDYILLNKNEKYYWRTSDFTPAKPEPFDEKYKTWLLGTDIVYLMLAYLNYENNDETHQLCLESLRNFSAFYIKARKDLGIKNRENSNWTDKPLWRIEYLDGRMIELVKNAELKKWQGFEPLVSFVKNDLKNLYAYDQKVLFAEDGDLDWSESTTPLLPVYEFLNPEKFKELFKGFVHGAMTPRGALPKGSLILGMNGSSYPLFLSYAYSAWKNKVISDEELIYVNNKFYTFFGSSDSLRDERDWVTELLPIDKKIPHWRASPDRGFVPNVMSEGLWQNSECQGFMMNWNVYNPGKVQPYYESGLNRIFRNDYIQFTAPFQSHAEPYPYGLAFTFNTLKFISKEINEKLITVKFERPDLPNELLCFGVLDITDIYFKNKNLENPTNLGVVNVTCNQKPLSFRIIGVPEINRAFSDVDNKKIIFCQPYGLKGEVEIQIHLDAKNSYLDDTGY